MKKRTLEFIFENKRQINLLLCLSMIVFAYFLSLTYFIIAGLIIIAIMIKLGGIKFEHFDDSWNFVSETPPNEMLEVMDDNFNLRKAKPIYRDYISSPTIKNNELGIDVKDSEPFWDGTWMFDLGEDFESTPASDIADFGKVTRWRKIKES